MCVGPVRPPTNLTPFSSVIQSPDLEDPPITLTSRPTRMRHSSQSEETPSASCSEVFQGGSCDLEAGPPLALARSSSASDVVMEPFVTERAKGDEPPNDPHIIPNSSHHLTPTFSLTASSLATPPPPLHSPASDHLTSYDAVLSSSLDELGDGIMYDQLWPGFASRGRASNSDWASVSDSALVFSPEREMDEEEGEIGEEDDLFSSIREYLTRGVERREEAAAGEKEKEKEKEKEGVASATDPSTVPQPVLVQTGIARTQAGPVGQVREVRQVAREDRQTSKDSRQVSKAVRHGSEDSGEENEAEQRSIYECLELQCQWPSPSSGSSSSSLERQAGRREKSEGKIEGEMGEEREGEQGRGDKDAALSEKRHQLMRQEPVEMEPSGATRPPTQTPSPDTSRGKLPRGRPKKRQASGVHVSFRPSTESVQFHNPLESKEAHWRARLRRLSHFHTHSHSAGERLGAAPGAKAGVGSLGGLPGANHKAGLHEKAGSGELSASGSSGSGDRSGAGGQECGDKDEEHQAGGTAHSEKPAGSSGSSGVRGRLGRSGLRPRGSRSRSQEPGSSGPRHHHQVALLGGVYKTVVHALSSKPRPRGQGSSQGSSPQRQVRGASGDAPLRDLYSHVLGYFGRKTAAPAGEDRSEPNDQPARRNTGTTEKKTKKHQDISEKHKHLQLSLPFFLAVFNRSVLTNDFFIFHFFGLILIILLLD